MTGAWVAMQGMLIFAIEVSKYIFGMTRTELRPLTVTERACFGCLDAAWIWLALDLA